jgi:hypothetical protein
MRSSPDAHLTADEVAMYLDARMSEADRRRVEAHLADCDICRGEVLEVRSMLRTAPRRSSTRWYTVAVTGAAAAAVLLIALPRHDARPTRGDGEPGTTERAVLPDASRDSVQIVAPSVGEIVARRALTFVWRRGSGDARFTVTLMNERGDVAWSANTRDTVVTLPTSVALGPRTTYILYVDALRVDGTSTRSSPRSFIVEQ